MIEPIHIIISLVCIALSSIFNSEMDTIMEFRRNPIGSKRRVGFFSFLHKYFEAWNWWWDYRDAKTFIAKLNPFRDGWHFTKAARVYFVLIPAAIMICLYFGWDTCWAFIINIPLFIYQGASFELGYNL